MNKIETSYPLLTAWHNGKLRESWNQERAVLQAEDPKLLSWVVDHEAAARLSAHLSTEYQRLAWEAKNHAWQHQADSHYTDEIIDFYDALQVDNLKSFRGELQEISGNRSLIADEIRYSASLNHEE